MNKRGPYDPWHRSQRDDGLRSLRLQAGLTQVQASLSLGVSLRSYVSYEQGAGRWCEAYTAKARRIWVKSAMTR